jgi:hypothetical protein
MNSWFGWSTANVAMLTCGNFRNGAGLGKFAAGRYIPGCPSRRLRRTGRSARQGDRDLPALLTEKQFEPWLSGEAGAGILKPRRAAQPYKRMAQATRRWASERGGVTHGIVPRPADGDRRNS